MQSGGTVDELTRILDELRQIDDDLNRVGAFVEGGRDELLDRRRRLESEFDALRRRPRYVEEIGEVVERTRADLLAHPVTQPFSVEQLRPPVGAA